MAVKTKTTAPKTTESRKIEEKDLNISSKSKNR